VARRSGDETRQEEYGRPRLELPDVVIYGKDLVILRRKKPSYGLQIEPEVRESRKRLAGRRIGVRIPKLPPGGEEVLAENWIRGQFGDYRSHFLEFVRSSTLSRVDYTLRLSHSQRGRWVENSRSAALGSNLKMAWRMRGVSFISAVEYRKLGFGYYGESTQDEGAFNEYLFSQKAFLPSSEWMFSVSKHSLDAFEENGSGNSEVTVLLSGSSQHSIESIPFGLQVYYLHAGGSGLLDVLRFAIHSSFTPYEWLNEKFGIDYFSANRVRRISPFMRFDADFGVVLFGQFRTFIEPHTVVDQIESNRYVRDLSPIAEEHMNSLTLGVSYTFTNGIRAQLTGSRENSKNKPYWKYEDHWTVCAMDVDRTSVKLDLTGQYVESLRGAFSLRYHDYSQSVPYVPTFEVEARAEYDSKFGVKVEAIATHVGDRTAPDSNLPAYTELDLRLEKTLVRNLAVFGGVENLLNADYEILTGYPEPGRKAYLGARLTF
jgi:outer membrane receptor protein involved in Fe transport